MLDEFKENVVSNEMKVKRLSDLELDKWMGELIWEIDEAHKRVPKMEFSSGFICPVEEYTYNEFEKKRDENNKIIKLILEEQEDRESFDTHFILFKKEWQNKAIKMLLESLKECEACEYKRCLKCIEVTIQDTMLKYLEKNFNVRAYRLNGQIVMEKDL
jgi:hypothetical protein